MNSPVNFNDPTGHMCSDPDDPTPSCENASASPRATTLPNPGGAAGRDGNGHSGNTNDRQDLEEELELNSKRPKALSENAESTGLFEQFLNYQYTPLAMGALQILTSTAYDVAPLILLPFPEALPLVAVIEGGLIVANRTASALGLASTYYQYDHNLYGTNKADLVVASVTFLVGTLGATSPKIVTAMSYGSFFWTAARTDWTNFP